MFPIDNIFLFLVGTIALLPITRLLAESLWPVDKDSNSKSIKRYRERHYN